MENNFFLFYLYAALSLVSILQISLLEWKLPPRETLRRRPERLKVNLLDKPLGVSKDGLRFSWSFEDPDANEYQSAYRIVVASSKLSFCRKNMFMTAVGAMPPHPPVWNQRVCLECLTDNGLYYWAVQVRDSQGLESELSQPEMLVTSVGINGLTRMEFGEAPVKNLCF